MMEWNTEKRYRILGEVVNAPTYGIRATDIADNLNFHDSTVVRALEEFESLGLVKQFDTTAWDHTIDGKKVYESLEVIQKRTAESGDLEEES